MAKYRNLHVVALNKNSVEHDGTTFGSLKFEKSGFEECQVSYLSELFFKDTSGLSVIDVSTCT